LSFWHCPAATGDHLADQCDEWYAVGVVLCLSAAPLVVCSFFVPAFSSSRPLVAEFTGIAFIGIALSRTVVDRIRIPRRIAIVGAPPLIDAALNHLRPRRDDAVLCLPVHDIEATLTGQQTMPPWLQGAIAWGASRVIMTQELPPDRLVRVMQISARHNVSVALLPGGLRQQAFQMHLEREGDLALLYLSPLPICTPAARVWKRFIDLALSIPALLALSPLLVLCAFAIKFDSPGPIIYRQTRVGRNAKTFEMLKLRSMSVDCELQTGPIWADPAMPQITRVGRFLRRTSIDEIPQLVNVLRGEMSLVGPRPERPYFVERFRASLPRYEQRLLVSPGITGWSQISMSRILVTDDVSLKLSGDLFYIAEWSPLLDAQILVKTAFEFLFHRVA
jgi:exopolysaccharide biosynthesis polyprenyl glycosylphosphotransferase